MGFINEAKYRLTQSPTPPFWKKLQRVGALVITTGISVAFIPGALTYGICAVGIGLGAAITAEFATNDRPQEVAVKVEQKEVEKAEQKLKEVTNKTQDK